MKNIALITGASSGIGKELAFIHAEKTGDLILVARRIDKLEGIAQQIKEKYQRQVICIAKDLSKPDAPLSLYDEVKEKGMVVEYLINNAGFGLLGKFNELAWERQAQMLQLNMVSLTQLTYLFLQDMTGRNSGRILNTSSTASFMPGPLQAVYYATKAYVTFFSNALWEELRKTNITVTNLMPGATETEFGATSGMDKTEVFQNTASALSVALDGYKAMMAGKLDVISGLTFSQKIMMKMIPFTPKQTILKQIRKLQEV
ncbi:MAG: SDR family oxidoreductase [Flavobacteriaceae bacterium]|nr:SDR family oxidoreductase [Flavobacteriaceae bacterium]